MKIKYNKNIIFNIFILLLLFFIVINYVRYDVLSYADRWETFKPSMDYLLNGGYPGRIINLIFYKLIPYYFPFINPNDLQPTIIGFIKSLIVILIVVVYTKIFYLFSNSKSVFQNRSFPFVSVIIFLFIFNPYNIYFFPIMQISDSTSFMDWSLPLLLFSMLFYYLARIFVKNEKLNRFEYYYLAVICILSGFSNVMFSLISLFLIGGIYLFQICCIRNRKSIIDFFLSLKKYNQLKLDFYSAKNKSSLFIHLNNLENIFLFLVLSAISTFILFGTTTYKVFNNVKDIYYFDYKFSFSSILMNLEDFIYKFIDSYINPFVYIYVVLFVVVFYVFYKKKKLFVNVITYIGILFFSLLSFLFIVLLTGNTQQSDFDLDNPMFLYSFIKVIILALCFILGYIFYCIELRNINKNEKVVISLISIYFFASFITNQLIDLYYFYKNYTNISKNIRIISYVSDKAAIESSKLDGKLLLPISYYEYYGCELYKIKMGYPYLFESIMNTYKEKMYEIKNGKSRIYTSNNFDPYLQSNDNYYFIYLKNIYNADIETLQFTTVGYIENELRNKNLKIKYDFNDNEYVWFSKLNDIKNKRIDYNKLVRDNSNSAWAYVARGRASKNKGDFLHAISDYTKAIELEPDNISYHFIRGLLYKYLNDFSKAIEDFQFVVNNNQKGLFSQYLLIHTLDLNENYITAIDRCGKLIKINPYGYSEKQMDIYYERANLKEKINDFKGAIKDYKKSAKISNYHFDSNLYKEVEINADDIDDLEDEIEYLLDIL